MQGNRHEQLWFAPSCLSLDYTSTPGAEDQSGCFGTDSPYYEARLLQGVGALAAASAMHGMAWACTEDWGSNRIALVPEAPTLARRALCLCPPRLPDCPPPHPCDAHARRPPPTG